MAFQRVAIAKQSQCTLFREKLQFMVKNMQILYLRTRKISLLWFMVSFSTYGGHHLWNKAWRRDAKSTHTVYLIIRTTIKVSNICSLVLPRHYFLIIFRCMLYYFSDLHESAYSQCTSQKPSCFWTFGLGPSAPLSPLKWRFVKCVSGLLPDNSLKKRTCPHQSQ